MKRQKYYSVKWKINKEENNENNEELKDENELKDILERAFLTKKEININNKNEKEENDIVYEKIREINQRNKKFSEITDNIFITQKLLNENYSKCSITPKKIIFRINNGKLIMKIKKMKIMKIL